MLPGPQGLRVWEPSAAATRTVLAGNLIKDYQGSDATVTVSPARGSRTAS